MSGEGRDLRICYNPQGHDNNRGSPECAGHHRMTSFPNDSPRSQEYHYPQFCTWGKKAVGGEFSRGEKGDGRTEIQPRCHQGRDACCHRDACRTESPSTKLLEAPTEAEGTLVAARSEGWPLTGTGSVQADGSGLNLTAVVSPRLCEYTENTSSG